MIDIVKNYRKKIWIGLFILISAVILVILQANLVFLQNFFAYFNNTASLTLSNPDAIVTESDTRGTTWTHLRFSDIAWKNPGGDWSDTQGKLQGRSAFAKSDVYDNDTVQTLNFNCPHVTSLGFACVVVLSSQIGY